MSAQQSSLVSFLLPVGRRIKSVGFKHIKRMTRLTGHMLTHQDVDHLALAAAFEAFLELGGVPEKPDAFDWSANLKTLEKRGLLWLRRETIGRKTEFGDISTRVASRLNSAFVDGYRWTAWSYQAQSEPHVKSNQGNNHLEYISPLEQEAVMIDHDLQNFEGDLRVAIEDEQALQWLIERFRDGVNQNEQIDRLVAETPKYQGPGGRAKAEAYIHKKISRAKQRAAALLAPKWRDLAREVAV